MQADKKIDLCGIIEPCSLLICKSALISLKPGAVIEIQLRDPETLKDLVAIIERSGETIIAREAHEDRTLLWVQKSVPGQLE
jgi:TusA-related sulfurtransferase